MLQPVYGKIVAMYRHIGAIHMEAGKVMSIPMRGFTEFFTKQDEQNDDFLDANFKTTDLDTVFVAARNVPQELKGEIKIRSENNLIRYQFLEALIRVAEAKYSQAPQPTIFRHFDGGIVFFRQFRCQNCLNRVELAVPVAQPLLQARSDTMFAAFI